MRSYGSLTVAGSRPFPSAVPRFRQPDTVACDRGLAVFGCPLTSAYDLLAPLAACRVHPIRLPRPLSLGRGRDFRNVVNYNCEVDVYQHKVDTNQY